MRIAPAITLNPDQQATLEQWARSRSLPARVVERVSSIAMDILPRGHSRPAGLGCTRAIIDGPALHLP